MKLINFVIFPDQRLTYQSGGRNNHDKTRLAFGMCADRAGDCGTDAGLGTDGAVGPRRHHRDRCRPGQRPRAG
ncbi:hypothetical protein SPHINGOT1_20359 [Sphingomonas sp. T1]|nr:hypothetical protein SPHINGOT1_20359 [Sphingomonas sp. T1]